MQGTLITLEGGEGSGKTSQLAKVWEWLQQHSLIRQWLQAGHFSQIISTREPGGTAVGSEIRQVLLHPNCGDSVDELSELLLYAADRAQHVNRFLRPNLAAGALILCDRFIDSTVAYQGYGRGLDLALIQQLNQIATGGLEPDLTIWLDIPPALGLERIRSRGSVDRLEGCDLAFHQQVRQGFATLATSHPERFCRVDASQDLEVVTHQIQGVILAHLLGRFNQTQHPCDCWNTRLHVYPVLGNTNGQPKGNSGGPWHQRGDWGCWVEALELS